ncbi:MAG: CapA family protein [Chlorobaculum sp.]|nr:CapA family protein [Chlorobaculum sp.]
MNRTLFFSRPVRASLCAALLFFCFASEGLPATRGEGQRKGVPADSSESGALTIVAVGDIMMGSSYPSADSLPPFGRSLLEPVVSILADADLTFGNLEGPILDEGPVVKKCADPSKCFAFRQPEYVAGYLKDAGFDLLSIANNHMNDFGIRGKRSTCRVLAEKGIHYAGQEFCPTAIVVRKGVKIGFTAFAPGTGSLDINDDDLVRMVVSGLKKQCDIVIVSFHGGAEGASRTHVPRQGEMFYGENRGDVYRFARLSIDSGADVVLGHGPHVARAIDLYKGKFIAYSMGNFCTYGKFNLKGPNGFAPVFRIRVDKNGDFINGRIFSVEQQGEGGPVIDSSAKAQQAIQRLTAEDLPNLRVQFDDRGRFAF